MIKVTWVGVKGTVTGRDPVEVVENMRLDAKRWLPEETRTNGTYMAGVACRVAIQSGVVLRFEDEATFLREMDRVGVIVMEEVDNNGNED